MVQKIELAKPHHETYANPAPLGLLGLAIGCAALTPIAFGHYLTEPTAFSTAAIFVLLFGCGCQGLAGYMEMRNGNGFGGVIFTTFAFLWAVNAWELHMVSNGVMPHHGIKLAIDVALLLILTPLTFGFGYFSKLLFALLIDIDLLFVCKIVRGVTHTDSLNMVIAILTVVLGLLGIWIALASLINPVAGRQVFRIAGPLFFAPKRPQFDFSLRRQLFETLYIHWREHAFVEMPLGDLANAMADIAAEGALVPDIEYLGEFGYVTVSRRDGEITSLRLTAAGIDLYEQIVLRKYEL